MTAGARGAIPQESPAGSSPAVTDEESTGRTSTVVGNASVMFAGRLIVAGLGWAGTLLIIRSLSVEQWGQFSFVFNFLALMTVVTNVVNARQAIRGYFDADDRGAFAGTYVTLRFALGLLGYPIALAVVIVGDYPEAVIRATAVAGLAIIIATPSVGFDAIFQVRRRLGPVAVANALGQLAQFALTVLLVMRHATLVVLTVPAVLCEIVTIGWKLRSIGPTLRMRYRVVWRTWLDLLRLGIPYAIGGALATIYYSIDSVMLSKMDTFDSVGLYGIAYKFAGVVQFIPIAVTASLLAVLVKHWPGDPSAFWATFNKVVLFLAICSGIVVSGFVLFAEPGIRLLYGADYVDAANATRLVIASECVGFFTALGVTTLVALNRNLLYPLAALAGAVLNIAMNLVLIPRWSYGGAAFATLLTELAVCTLLWIPVLRVPDRPSLPFGGIARVLIVTAAACGAALMTVAVAPWPVAAAVLVVVYVSLIHFTRIPGPGGLRSLLRDPDAEAAQ